MQLELMLIAALSLSGGAPASRPACDVVFTDGDNKWVYRADSLDGWRVYVDKRLVGRKKLIDDLYRELRKSLKHIKKAVPAGPVAKLQAVPIWVSDEKAYPFRPGEKGVIPFHRSRQWLREHGLNPHMAPGVHVINPAAVLYEHKMFEWGPMTILHELAHSYHNLHLRLSNREVLRAYRKAMSRGLYLKVPDRSDPAKKVKAYAATNHEEYFAELTEAYFGRNDWYPKNRAELKRYDPAGYRMIERVWKVTGKKPAAPATKPGREAQGRP